MRRRSDCGGHVENGMNVDPVPVGTEEFEADPPFRKLHVRVRGQIVADGFESPLDWRDAGYDMPPMEWHRRIKEARDRASESPSNDADGETPRGAPIVLDCRNKYETRVGRFELAEPLGTVNFRETMAAAKADRRHRGTTARSRGAMAMATATATRQQRTRMAMSTGHLTGARTMF